MLYILLGAILVVLFISVGVFLFRKFGNKDNLYLQAEKCINNGEYEKAKNICIGLIDSNPGDFVIRYLLGQAYEGLKDYTQAIYYYEKASIFASSSTNETLKMKFFLKIADIYKRLKKNKEAMGYYALVLDKEPQNHKALLASGELLIELGSFQKARKVLESFVQIKPDHLRSRFLLAKVYGKLNLFQDASVHLEFILQNNKLEDDVLKTNASMFLADIYQKMKVYQKVIDVLSPLLDESKYFEDVIGNVIEAMIMLNQLDEALTLINTYIGSVSKDKKCELTYLIASSYFKQRKYYEAVRKWVEAYELNPQYRDLNDIMSKYHPIIKNQKMEGIFTEDENKVELFLKKAFKGKSLSKMVKRKNFWVFEVNDVSTVLYKVPFPTPVKELTEIEEVIRRNFHFGSFFTLYSLYGISAAEDDNFNRKKVELINNDAFVIFVNSVD